MGGRDLFRWQEFRLGGLKILLLIKTPEQIARDKIDTLLAACGWIVQDLKKIDWSQGLGIAVREYPTDTGPADYLLFVGRKPVGIIVSNQFF